MQVNDNNINADRQRKKGSIDLEFCAANKILLKVCKFGVFTAVRYTATHVTCSSHKRGAKKGKKQCLDAARALWSALMSE